MFAMLFSGRKQKELKMIWKVEKGGRESFLVGTAHFFPYSFRDSITRYAGGAETVILEGPLDEDSMRKVQKAGFDGSHSRNLLSELDAGTVAAITEALVPYCRKRSSFVLVDYGRSATANPVHEMVNGMKPWMAFFTIWTGFLERKGWKYSVDLEGYRVAKELGKKIVFLESIEEQIRVLESLSYERIIGFLKRVEHWEEYTQEYARRYLAGDFTGLKSVGIGFPSRATSVIEHRDQVQFQRMLPYLENGKALVFVGAPHVRGIRALLESVGYSVDGPSTR